MTLPQPENKIPHHKAIRPAARKIIIILLFAFGLELWLNAGHAIIGRKYQWAALLIIFCLNLIPTVRNSVSAGLDWFRGWSARHANLATLIIAFAAAFFL